MRKILFLLGILLAGMPNVMAFNFALLGGKVKDGVLNVYLNTEDFTPFLSVPEVEAIMIESFAYINQIPTSSVRVNYKGRTTLSCDDTRDGIIVYCFKGKQDAPGGFGLSWGRISGGLVTDGWVYMRNDYSFSRLHIKVVIIHETLHILRLDHYNEGKSIMGNQTTGQGYPLTTVSNTFTDYDIAALSHLYPYSKDCAAEVSEQGGKFVMTLESVQVEGQFYHVELLVDTERFTLSVMNIAPSTESSCTLDFYDNQLQIPYAHFAGQYYSLDTRYAGNMALEVTGYKFAD